MKKRKLKVKVSGNKKYIHLLCSKCNKIDRIHTNNPDLYEDYFKGKKWICILCKGPKKR